jgi:manganese transport protein
MFTSDRRLMGEFVNPLWLKVLAYAVATIPSNLLPTAEIVGLNSWLLLQTCWGWLHLGSLWQEFY